MADSSTGYRLGVDLGTTYTAAAVHRNNETRMVPLGVRQPEIPSVLAGCENATLMPEPVAAAHYYATQGRISQGQRLAVFDFGGGTFDAAIIEASGNGFTVIGEPKGLERLGGIDLDHAVLTTPGPATDKTTTGKTTASKPGNTPRIL